MPRCCNAADLARPTPPLVSERIPPNINGKRRNAIASHLLSVFTTRSKK